MGSQISNLRDIAAGMREAVRYFVELSKAGCMIRFMDSGGGLGVDYEGTRSRGACSINYRLEQFAQTLIQPLQEACAEHGLPEPRMITEAGRAMTAHHAMMVVNVSEVEQAPDGAVPDARTGLARFDCATHSVQYSMVRPIGRSAYTGATGNGRAVPPHV